MTIDRLDIRKVAQKEGWTVTPEEDAVPDSTHYSHPSRGELTVWWTQSIQVHAFEHRQGGNSLYKGRATKGKREHVMAILEGENR